MGARNLEERFERFCRSGDVAALGEVFDALAPDLLRIARRIAPSRAEIEDLVQATFLAAIERAQSFDSQRALRPWLVGILVRQAGLARRRAGRTVELDEGAASSREEPSDALGDREFAEELARAVSRLTPAEREVLVPLLYDEKRAVQIARELEQRPDTVHMRIHRGIAHLRKLLPASFGLGLAAAFLERRALARMKQEVIHMAQISIASSSVISVAVPSSVGLGGALLTSKLALSSLLVAVGLVLVSISRPWESFRDSSRSVSIAQPAMEAPGGESSAGPVISSSARTPSVPDAAAGSAAGFASLQTPSKWVVKGRLNGLQSGEMLPSSLKIEPLNKSGLLGAALTTEVPPAGVFEADVTSLFAGVATKPPHELVLTADHPRYVVSKTKVLVESGELVAAGDGTSRVEFQRDVDLELAAIVRGQVIAPAGSNGTKCYAAIHRIGAASPTFRPEDAVECGPGGEFRLRVASSADYVVVASTQASAPSTVPVSAVVGAERVLPVITLDPGLAISGVVMASGAPQPGIKVIARLESPSTSPPPSPPAGQQEWSMTAIGSGSSKLPGDLFRWTAQGFVRDAAKAQSDAQGRFTITGLAAIEYLVSTRGCSAVTNLVLDNSASAGEVPIEAPAENINLPVTCAVIEFRLLGVEPQAGALQITAMPAGSGLMLGHDVPYAAVERVGFSPNLSAHIGFRIKGYEPVSADYTFPGPGEERVECVQFVAVSKAKLVVRLLAEDGSPIPQAAFGFCTQQWLANQSTFVPAFTAEAESANGELVLDPINAGNYRVRVHTGGSYYSYAGYYRELEFDVLLAPGAQETRMLTLALGGRIRASLLTGSPEMESAPVKLYDVAGNECQVLFRTVEGHKETEAPGSLFVGANDTFPNLAPGEYRLKVRRDPQAPLFVPVTVLAGKTSEVTIDLGAP